MVCIWGTCRLTGNLKQHPPALASASTSTSASKCRIRPAVGVPRFLRPTLGLQIINFFLICMWGPSLKRPSCIFVELIMMCSFKQLLRLSLPTWLGACLYEEFLTGSLTCFKKFVIASPLPIANVPPSASSCMSLFVSLTKSITETFCFKFDPWALALEA